MPYLFYYWSGGQNKRYKALKEFKKITLISPLAKGIISNIECADTGKIRVDGETDPCKIAFYTVDIYAGNKRTGKVFNLLCGVTDSGMRLPYQNFIKLEQYNSTQGTKEIMNFFGNKFFDYPKPSEMIKYLINICPEKDEIILDFFSGSATTAHAAMQLNAEDGCNRKFICVQLPEVCDEKSEAYKAGYKNICEIGKERIRRAGAKILEEYNSAQLQIGEEEKKPLDVGFKVFKLDTSNLKTWDSTPIGDNQLNLFYERLNSMIDTVKDDRTDMDVVYEVMLKMGITLDTPVTYIEVNGKIVYIVGEFLLMVCLTSNITAEDMEGMAAYAPAKIVCAESGFADDSALSNAHYILKDKNIELKLV